MARALSALILASLVGAWELIYRLTNADPLLTASPMQVARALVTERAVLAEHTLVTMSEALIGFALAFVIGFGCAITLHLSRVLRESAYPLLIASQSIPVVVLAPLLVLAFGYDMRPKIAIVVLVCFFPIVVSMIDGLRSVDPELRTLIRSYGAGRVRILRMVELPASLPAVFTGARIAATWAFIGAVLGEYAGASSGLGYLITSGTPFFEIARAYAAVVILVVMSLSLFGLIVFVERLAIPPNKRAA